jgi:hypothetical protein
MPEHVHLLLNEPGQGMLADVSSRNGRREIARQRPKGELRGCFGSQVSSHNPLANLGHRAYSVERSQFCSRSPLTRENSLSLSVTIT